MITTEQLGAQFSSPAPRGSGACTHHGNDAQRYSVCHGGLGIKRRLRT